MADSHPTAPNPSSATLGAAAADRELIEACRTYAAAIDTYNRDGGRLEYEECPLYARLEAARERAETAPPPQTWDGVRAVAELCQAMADKQDDGTLNYSDSYCGTWPADVIEAVLRLTQPRA